MFEFNKRIICVDDDESMIDAYRQAIGGDPEDIFSDILDDAVLADNGRVQDFDLILARSGEEAVEIITQGKKNGKRIAAGFFDMRMPGGMDGYETIKKAREIDDAILCAVVTAYTDRSVAQIANLFHAEHQDELLYFSKPFRAAELEQTAVNMVCSWNRKRKMEGQLRTIEKSREGLSYILKAVAELVGIPPRPLQKMLSGILCQSLALVNSEDGYIAIFDEGDNFLVSSSCGSFADKNLNRITLDDPVIKKHLAEKQIYVHARRCIIPLIYSQKRLGIICLEAKTRFGEDLEKNILEVFRTQMVPLIMNSIFYDELLKKDLQVVTDPLTGLYNRRFIMRRFREELSRSSRYSYPVAVLMIDLDDFKAINDTHGHAAGDFVLRTVGQLLQAAVRDYDIVGRNVDESACDKFAIRYGGEEFSVILSQTGKEGAALVAERIRKAVADHDFRFGEIIIKLTVSVGIGLDIIARKDLGDEAVISAILNKADEALYRAKALGKNRVEVD